MRCYRKAEDPSPEWELPLQNTSVVGNPDTLEIQIRAWGRVEEFVADNLNHYTDWYHALRYASEKSIKDYYAFVKTLGKGHFSKVLLAKDRRTREKFAVKVIKKTPSDDRATTLMHRELEILRMVNHQNIVRLYDLFDTNDKLYVVLEYLDGGALYGAVRELGHHYSEQRASHIIKEVLQGLVYLHSKGIVHRDVKPENIITTSKQWPFTCKLADFGLSNFLGQGFLQSKVGTPYFCAREVITSESYGTKADLWSLGVVAYEMLSGKKPFEGTTTRSVLQAILAGEYHFPRQEWEKISDLARDFVSGLICIDVDRRLSAEEALRHPWIVNEGRLDGLMSRHSIGVSKPQFDPNLIHANQSDESMEVDEDEQF